MVAKAEHNAHGANPRFVVTNLRDAPQALYETMYCARGEMENRIKDCQLGLFSDRTSCHLWWPNQFRLLLAALAYVLLERLRTIGLAGTELARAQVWILRCRLLKVGAVIVRDDDQRGLGVVRPNSPTCPKSRQPRASPALSLQIRRARAKITARMKYAG